LKNIFLSLGAAPPEFLNIPVSHHHMVTPPQPPKALIRPVLDGRATDYFEWSNASSVKILAGGGAMYRSSICFDKLHYGFDLSNLYLRLDPVPTCKFDGEFRLDSHLEVKGRQFVLSFPLLKGGTGDIPMSLAETKNWVETINRTVLKLVAIGKIVEFAVPFNLLDARDSDEIMLSMYLMKGKVEISRYPINAHFSIKVPGKSYDQEMWSV